MLKGSAFPLEAGLNQLSTGTFDLVKGIRAYQDTIITITPTTGTPYTETVVAGEDREILNCKTLEVTSGLCSLTRRTIA